MSQNIKVRALIDSGLITKEGSIPNYSSLSLSKASKCCVESLKFINKYKSNLRVKFNEKRDKLSPPAEQIVLGYIESVKTNETPDVPPKLQKALTEINKLIVSLPNFPEHINIILDKVLVESVDVAPRSSSRKECADKINMYSDIVESIRELKNFKPRMR